MKSVKCKNCVGFKQGKCYRDPTPVDKLPGEWCMSFAYETAFKHRVANPVPAFQPAEMREEDTP